ncbi:hypothetical protein niasHS_009017 [Heterodera schachtii]|uniref:Uncharacterized protein n=1 Tax=Heterodera schachtii TaxID=97005 RepID=A0ABD2J5J3_HETSC
MCNMIHEQIQNMFGSHGPICSNNQRMHNTGMPMSINNRQMHHGGHIMHVNMQAIHRCHGHMHRSKAHLHLGGQTLRICGGNKMPMQAKSIPTIFMWMVTQLLFKKEMI